MDPFTLALMGAGSAVNALGKLLGGSSSKALMGIKADIAGVNAGVANTNADLLDTQAEIAGMGVDFAWAKAKTQIGRIQETGRQTLASQRSYFAAGNLDPTFGSPLLVQALTAGRVQSDIDLTEANASVEAADARTRQASIRAQAAGQRGSALGQLYEQAAAKMKGDADMTAGVLGAATSFLSFGGAVGRSGLFDGGSTLSSFQVGDQTFPMYR